MNTEFFAYQIIIFFVALLLILRSIFQFLKGKKNFRELVLSIIIWGLFTVFALFPNLSQSIAHLVGFELGINFILTVTTIILFASVVMLIVKTDKNNSSLTQLVRELALKDIENSTKNQEKERQ